MMANDATGTRITHQLRIYQRIPSVIYSLTLITLDVLRIHPHTFIEATQLFVELDVTSIQVGPCLAVGFAEDSVQDRAWFVPR